MFILRFDLESACALRDAPETEENWQAWLEEALAGVTQITRVLNQNDAPATFFIVGQVLEKAGEKLAGLLKNNPGFDIESHTYSHMYIKGNDPEALQKFSEEMKRTSDLILDYFGKRPIGFCAPGNFYKGLQGHPRQLGILWEQGYRFIGTDGSGPPEQWMPAPFTQPYWYAEDGFPDLLEEPLTGWHCNMLFNTGGQSDDWQPAPGLPDGTIFDTLPTTLDEGLQVRKKEFQHAIENNLIYAPCYHPWSIYRFDPEMIQLSRLIEMAKANNVPILNCKQLYEKYRDAKTA